MPERRKRMVKMCVCHRTSFEQIYEEAHKRNLLSTEELIKAKVCGTGCGMCHPYINKMMVTGQTMFVPGDVYIIPDAISS